MSQKSYVTLEAALCPACGQQHQTGSLLMDMRLRERFDKETTTHWAMCPEHQKLKDDGFIALVEIDHQKSDWPLTPASVLRTGQMAHVKASAWPHIFATPVPTKGLCFCETGTIAKLQELMPPNPDADEQPH